MNCNTRRTCSISALGVAIAAALGKRFGAQFKIGRYIADQHATDTTKGWIVVTYQL